jgi:hypothetical protein
MRLEVLPSVTYSACTDSMTFLLGYLDVIEPIELL